MWIRLAVLASLTFFSHFSIADDSPVQVPVNLHKAFAPVGFDDNDVSQVMVAGQFTDSCHKLGPVRVEVDSAKGQVFIQQTAYQYSEVCLRMMVPFVNVVDLGILRAANYELFDVSSKGKLGTLSILRAKSPAADDYLYAPVSDADIVPSADGSKHILTLRGHFTNRCSKIKEVAVHHYADSVVVQPIMEYAEADTCVYAKVRFAHTVELKQKVVGETLLHIRVTNGKAINKLIDLP